MAGLCSDSVRQATVQHWMMVGVYFTRIFLHKIKKIKSPQCLGCEQKNEDLNHLLLHCSYYDEQQLPESLIKNWVSVKTAYSLSRQFCYSINRTREKYYSEHDK